MTEARKQAIRSAVAQLQVEGKKVSENAVLAIAGGSRTNSRPLIREVMAELAAEDAPSQDPTPPPVPAAVPVPVPAPVAPGGVDQEPRYFCVVTKAFVATDHELMPGTVVDVSDWRQSNVSGLLKGRYLRPYDADLDAHLPRPVADPAPTVPEAAAYRQRTRG